jgi:hypothetical protein
MLQPETTVSRDCQRYEPRQQGPGLGLSISS